MEHPPRNRIAKARVAAGLSQDEAAARIGVTKATIQNWESGRRKQISGAHLVKAAEVYGCSEASLLEPPATSPDEDLQGLGRVGEDAPPRPERERAAG